MDAWQGPASPHIRFGGCRRDHDCACLRAARVVGITLHCGVASQGTRTIANRSAAAGRPVTRPARRSRAENGAVWDLAGFEIAPERDEQLSRQGDDEGTAGTPLRRADALLVPARQSARGLPSQPEPGEFDQDAAGASVASLADALLA